MPPKKTSATRTKRSSNIGQPILSFQSQKPAPLPTKSKSTSISDSNINVKPTISRTPSAIDESTVHDIHLTNENDLGREDKEGKAKRERKREKLNPKDKRWDGLIRESKIAMGEMGGIHLHNENEVHQILRVFDMTSRYGPCVGVTRLQRWERAKKWGLNPPDEIREILSTEQGEDDQSYRENVLYAWLG